MSTSIKADIRKALPTGAKALGVSVNYLADRVGCSPSTARKAVAELVTERAVERVDDNARTPLYKGIKMATGAPVAPAKRVRPTGKLAPSADGRNGGGRKARKPAQTAVEAPAPAVVPDVQAEPAPAAPHKLDGLIGALESARPVSAPPAKAPRAKSEFVVNGQSKPTRPEDAADYSRPGSLRDAVVEHVRGLGRKHPGATAWEIAQAIRAQHSQPVLTNLKRQIEAGTLRRVESEDGKLRVLAA